VGPPSDRVVHAFAVTLTAAEQLGGVHPSKTQVRPVDTHAAEVAPVHTPETGLQPVPSVLQWHSAAPASVSRVPLQLAESMYEKHLEVHPPPHRQPEDVHVVPTVMGVQVDESDPVQPFPPGVPASKKHPAAVQAAPPSPASAVAHAGAPAPVHPFPPEGPASKLHAPLQDV